MGFLARDISLSLGNPRHRWWAHQNRSWSDCEHLLPSVWVESTHSHPSTLSRPKVVSRHCHYPATLSVLVKAGTAAAAPEPGINVVRCALSFLLLPDPCPTHSWHRFGVSVCASWLTPNCVWDSSCLGSGGTSFIHWLARVFIQDMFTEHLIQVRPGVDARERAGTERTKLPAIMDLPFSWEDILIRKINKQKV